jgi:hypothetical protein
MIRLATGCGNGRRPHRLLFECSNERLNRGLVYALLALLCFANPGLGAAMPSLNDASDFTVPLGGVPAPPMPWQKAEVDTADPSRTVRGNPHWAVPLESLRATRERPLFAPTRRPPAPFVAARPPDPAPPPSPPTVEHPNLTLVGTARSEGNSIAVFSIESSRETVRLGIRQGHMGWILNSVGRDSATLQKGTQTETLKLPAPLAQGASVPTTSSSAAADPNAPVPVIWKMPSSASGGIPSALPMFCGSC